MASQMDVHNVSLNIGAYIGNAVLPLIYIPATGGDLTILDAQIIGTGAGTSIGLLLVQETDAGTPAADGTLATWSGTVVYAAGVPAEATVGTPTLACGKWIGLKQTSGTTAGTTILSVNYVMGK